MYRLVATLTLQGGITSYVTSSARDGTGETSPCTALLECSLICYTNKITSLILRRDYTNGTSVIENKEFLYHRTYRSW